MPGVNPGSQRANFELPLQVKERAATRAKAEGQSMTAIVVAALRAYGDGAQSVRFPKAKVDPGQVKGT